MLSGDISRFSSIHPLVYLSLTNPSDLGVYYLCYYLFSDAARQPLQYSNTFSGLSNCLICFESVFIDPL